MSEGILFRQSAYAGGEEKRSTLGKLLVALNILLGLIIVAELVFHFVIAPGLELKKVHVESEIMLSTDEVLHIAGLSRKEYYFSLDIDTVRGNLETNPLVRKAHVEKVFPDLLRIVIYGRNPIAVSFVDDNGRSVPVALDDEGVVFRTGREALAINLPIISGIDPEALKVGSRLGPEYVQYLSELRSLKDKSPELFGFISELRLIKRGGRALEALLFPIHYRVPVRIGTEIDSRLCTYIMMVLDVMKQEDVIGNLDELDFRTGEVVYRTRGE